MEEKSQNYEGIFTFLSDEKFKQELEKNPEMMAEHERMQKVSALLQEVKPYFIKKRRDTAKMKIACAISFIMLSGTVMGLINFNSDIADVLRYGNTLEAEDYGFPVDDYGFLLVE